MQLPMAEMGIKAGARQAMESWNPLGWGLQLGMAQTPPKPHKDSCSGCRDQGQPVGHFFVLSAHLERWCCELGVF